MIYTALTNKAMKIAYSAHHGQTDKSGLPYIFHPYHLAEQMTDETSTCVALLHDVVEDTPLSLDDLAQKFPPAVIEALRLLKEPCEVELYSDSKYVIDALSKGWVYGWQKKGWVKSDKKPALNVDLWERLLPLIAAHDVRYYWVKGHAENEYNNRCDELAVAESRKYK